MADEGADAGSVYVKAAWDGSDLEAGLGRLERDLSEASSGARGMMASVESMLPGTKAMTGLFEKFGLISTGAIASIIAMSPLLQARLAQIGFQVQLALRDLAPGFEHIYDRMLEFAKKARVEISQLGQPTKEFLADLMTISALSFAGYKVGGVPGGIAGAVAGMALTGPGLAAGLAGGIAGAKIGGAVAGPYGAAGGAFLGGAAGLMGGEKFGERYGPSMLLGSLAAAGGVAVGMTAAAPLTGLAAAGYLAGEAARAITSPNQENIDIQVTVKGGRQAQSLANDIAALLGRRSYDGIGTGVSA